MNEHQDYHLDTHQHNSIHLEALLEIKRKLYEINNFDKLESVNEIFTNLRQYDEDLAKTLTLIISDFNTQMNMYQSHFIHVIDRIITLEEKRVIRELARPHTARATDIPVSTGLAESSGVQHTEAPQVIINNHINETDDDTSVLDLIKENKLIVIGVLIFIGLLINPVAVKNTISLVEKISVTIDDKPNDTPDNKSDTNQTEKKEAK